MKEKTRKIITRIIFALSLFFNVAAAVLFVFAASLKTKQIYYAEPDGASWLVAATVAGVPEGGEIVFPAVEIKIKKGESAFLQFSAVARDRQADRLITALFDREIISVTENGNGVLITALRAGETVMQTLTGEGIRDVARLFVSETEGIDQ
jgi:hypothetical protein